MFANILVLVLIIGLAILFGWLTYRAVRAKRLWVKIAGGIGAGLLTLLLGALIATEFSLAVVLPSKEVYCTIQKSPNI